MYTSTCAPNTTVSIHACVCGFCEDGYSVPINKCVQCDDPDDPPRIPKGWILFVTNYSTQ